MCVLRVLVLQMKTTIHSDSGAIRFWTLSSGVLMWTLGKHTPLTPSHLKRWFLPPSSSVHMPGVLLPTPVPHAVSQVQMWDWETGHPYHQPSKDCGRQPGPSLRSDHSHKGPCSSKTRLRVIRVHSPGQEIGKKEGRKPRDLLAAPYFTRFPDAEWGKPNILIFKEETELRSEATCPRTRGKFRWERTNDSL